MDKSNEQNVYAIVLFNKLNYLNETKGNQESSKEFLIIKLMNTAWNFQL